MSSYVKFISTIDSHTAGECTRLVTGGLPPLRGDTVAEKLAYAQAKLSWVPRLLMLEPRGHKDMYGAVLVPPCAPGTDIGVIFMDNKGYEPMCGHGTIGVVTTLLETGMFDLVEPVTELVLDTGAGVVRAYAQVAAGRVTSVMIDNVPSFLYKSEVRLDVRGAGEITVDIAFGGNFFVLVNAKQLKQELIPANGQALSRLGMAILGAANRQVTVRHPELPDITRIIDLRFYVEPGRNGARSQNVVILGDGMVDRSPCGTGTSAELAMRYARGEIGLNEPMVVESLIGTTFTGQVMGETFVGSGAERIPAIRPRIGGRAHVTGFHQFVLDAEDPFPAGFMVG